VAAKIGAKIDLASQGLQGVRDLVGLLLLSSQEDKKLRQLQGFDFLRHGPPVE
jgi:hypothetical protein